MIKQRVKSEWHDVILVIAFALGLRLVFLAITSDTYDYDEFVLLQLARDFSHGATPYHDFLFFHPPGTLYLLRLIEPVTQHWWRAARLGMALVDTTTAAMVWRLGLLLYGRRGGIVSGLIYSCSPLALISGGRVEQDPLLTAFGIAGLLLLLTGAGWKTAVTAGLCLGAAVCVKYPALIFLPVYVLAAPRRAVLAIGSAVLTLVGLFAPFHDHLGAIYEQTVTFQRTRWDMDPAERWQTTALFWLGTNPLAPVAAITERAPAWLLTGFGLGGFFVLTSQVYYHYFVPVVPFAALLAAPLILRVPKRVVPWVMLAGLSIAVAWGGLLNRASGSFLYVTTAHLSDIAPTVTWIQHNTRSADAVLADRFEYSYLSNRPAALEYFWNVGVLVDADDLEHQLPRRGAVILSHGASSGYPSEFTEYLDARYRRIRVGITDVWSLGR